MTPGALFFLLLSVTSLTDFAGSAFTPSDYIAGAWLPIKITVAPEDENAATFTLAIIADGKTSFTCQIDAPKANENSLCFWVLAPRTSSHLWLTVRARSGAIITQSSRGEIKPSSSPTLLTATLNFPLASGEFYAPYQTLYLPAPQPTWTRAEKKSFLAWLRQGGAALTNDRQFFTDFFATYPADRAPVPLSIAFEKTPSLMGYYERGALLYVAEMADFAAVSAKINAAYVPLKPRYKDDWRLAEKRYRDLPELTLPRLPLAVLAAWIGSWVILSAVSLFLIPANWREKRWAIIGGGTIIFSGIFLFANPPLENLCWREVITSDANYGGREETLIIVPVASGEKITLAYQGTPYKLLASNARELAAQTVGLNLDANGGQITVHSPLSQRGVPLIFTRPVYIGK